MKKGITLESETEGTGAVATRGSYVTIRCTGFLNHGQPIREELTSQIKLGAREVIAGLEYTIEGMKVGGKRRVRISPHLAYRDKGCPGVPPNAVVVYDIEVLAVEESANDPRWRPVPSTPEEK